MVKVQGCGVSVEMMADIENAEGLYVASTPSNEIRQEDDDEIVEIYGT